MLEELFSNGKMVRVIEHFVIHEKWKQNKKELCENLEIYPELMKEILEKLIEFNLIEVTNQIARSKFYRINKQSRLLPFLRGLIQEFGMQRSLMIAEEEMNKEEMNKEEINKEEMNKEEIKEEEREYNYKEVDQK